MASALVDGGKNAALNGSGLAATATYASLHTGAPGTTGTNEVTGGSPAYARKALTWGAASAGSMALTSPPTFDVPPSTTVAYVGMWTASTSGTFLGYWDVTDEVYAGQGTYALTTSLTWSM